mgnify:CR=1 FL=1
MLPVTTKVTTAATTPIIANLPFQRSARSQWVSYSGLIRGQWILIVFVQRPGGMQGRRCNEDQQ